MNPDSRGIAGALARGWRAIVRAFTPTEGSRAPRADGGADTTLFGAMSEQGSNRRSVHGTRDGGWDPTGESTDFADPDLGGDSRRH